MTVIFDEKVSGLVVCRARLGRSPRYRRQSQKNVLYHSRSITRLQSETRQRHSADTLFDFAPEQLGSSVARRAMASNGSSFMGATVGAWEV